MFSLGVSSSCSGVLPHIKTFMFILPPVHLTEAPEVDLHARWFPGVISWLPTAPSAAAIHGSNAPSDEASDE